jgi:hypothetical protein
MVDVVYRKLLTIMHIGLTQRSESVKLLNVLISSSLLYYSSFREYAA